MTCYTQGSQSRELESANVHKLSNLVTVIMDAHHSPKSDQSNQSIWREKTQADHKSISECLQILFVHACVDNEKEDGRDLSLASERILDSSVFGQKFCGEIGVRYILVMRRKRVSGKTKRADPEFSANIYLATIWSADRSLAHLAFEIRTSTGLGLLDRAVCMQLAHTIQGVDPREL